MSHLSHTAEIERIEQTTSFGFWMYLMTDCILFASLFATYAVLRGNTAAGPVGIDIFQMPMVLAETLILLTSSFICALTLLALKYNKKKLLIAALLCVGLLGAAFLAIELGEFGSLIAEGHSWTRSAFLSAFFTLVGTHGAHIAIGLLWLIVLLCVTVKRGLTSKTRRQIVLFGLFWHFLDIIWIIIFTVVYLLGVV